MDYQKQYNLLISKARSEDRTKGNDVYYESHHIIPVCLGGEGSRTDLSHPNIILLTAREHIIAHRLLHSIYPDNTKLAYAYWSMAHNPRYGDLNYRMGCRQYEEIKKIIANEMSLRRIGNDPWNKGIVYTKIQGEKNPDSRLTSSDINEIRNTHLGVTYRELSKKFNVSVQTISKIVLGLSWSHIEFTEEQLDLLKRRRRVMDGQPQGEDNWISKMTYEKVRWVRIHYIKGHYTFGNNPLSEMFEINRKTMSSIISGKTWKSVVLSEEDLKEREYHLLKYPMNGKKSEGHSGSKNGPSKLTEEKVLKMRELYETGKYSYTQLMKIFEVSKSTVSAVITKRYWIHI